MKWRCAWCGREYDTEEPPCDTCGHETFDPVSEDDPSPFGGGSVAWVCADCGREHVKHSPPCARCGGHDLERRETGTEDLSEEVASPGYLSVGKPYIAGVALVVALVVLVVTGVVPFPGFGAPPAPPDAPGDAERAGEIALPEAETALYDRFETERRSAGAPERSFGDGGTDAYVAYVTAHRVAERYDPDYDGSVPDPEAFDLRCGSRPILGVLSPSVDAGAYDDAAGFADALAAALLADDELRAAVLDDRDREAVSIHVAPDGAVFVGYLAC